MDIHRQRKPVVVAEALILSREHAPDEDQPFRWPTRRRGGIFVLRHLTAPEMSSTTWTFHRTAANMTTAFSSSSVWSCGSCWMRGRA